MLNRLTSFISAFSCRLQVAKMGDKTRVLPGLILSGGKNIIVGSRVYIGRNVVLDASHGTIEIGDGCEIRDGVRIFAKQIKLGNKVTLGEGAFLNGKITLQNGAWLARGCDLSGDVYVEKAILGPYTLCVGASDHERDPVSGAIIMRSPEDQTAAIRICEGAWTGARSIILPGVIVNNNTVVAAGAVVTKSYPAGAVLKGVPAKIQAADL